MYKDPLLTSEQNSKNKQRLQCKLENSVVKLTNPGATKSDEQFMSDLMQHCHGLRALESYDVNEKD